MHNIGGQAVIEGVMMKSARAWSVAVRDPRGEIQVKNVPLKPTPRPFKKPVLRGVLALFHALVIGMQIGFGFQVCRRNMPADTNTAFSVQPLFPLPRARDDL